MQKIKKVISQNEEVNALQVNFTSVINPILRNNPILFGNTLTSVPLVVGSNSINTGLDRTLQGWVIIRKRGQANIYDAQDFNPAPTNTLNLVSDAVVTVDLIVF